MLRMFLLAIIFELGAIYSIQAGDSMSIGVPQQSIENLQNQPSFIESNDLFNDFAPFELQEKNEQNEINEEESHDIISILWEDFNAAIFAHLKVVLTTIEHYSISYLYHSLPLFLVFHTWKIHI